MNNLYTLEKIDIDKFQISKAKLDHYFEQNISKYSDFNYLYWDKIKFQPVPKWFKDSKDLWGTIKFMRTLNYVSPIKTDSWEFFRFWELEFSKKLLHEIDKNASWTFYTPFSESDKRLFVTNWMLEEAISSSQLEWASTTSRNAVKMIKQWIKPKNDSDRMILNNYEVMYFVKDELVKKEKIDESDLLYLQEILTKWVIENKWEIWRFRDINDDNKDPIVVKFKWKIAHEPMKSEKMRVELKRLIDFMNDEGDFNTFVHPVIKAIVIHFWIWYLHPFCDWNGRTARALFYWYLLKNDYFWFSFIPLSSIIKKSKIEYAKSYIYSEQDDRDLWYFINYNLRKIKIALDAFQSDLKNRFKDNHSNLKDLRHLDLNDRQKKLLKYFLENKDSFTNSLIHKNYYNISKPTAVSDLNILRKKWLIYSTKSWRNISYFPVENLENLIKKD